MRVLVVCTANICRSPVAEAMLRREAEQRGVAAEVTSAGVRARAGDPAADGSFQAVAALGLVLDSHRSRAATDDLAAAADLVLAMEAGHVIDLAGRQPQLFPRAFTLREIVARARDVGPRGDTPVDQWLASLNDGRRAADLFGATHLDVADPYGGSRRDYDRCVAELGQLTAELATALWGPTGT